MRTVLVPRTSGVLSALGLAVSDERRDHAAPRARRRRPRGGAGRLAERAAAELPGAALERTADVRYRGQSFELDGGGRRPRRAARALPRGPRAALRLPPGGRARGGGAAARGRDAGRGPPGARRRARRGRRRDGPAPHRVEGVAWTRRCSTAAGSVPARSCAARRSSSSTARRASSRRAGRAASTPPARWCWRGRARDARSPSSLSVLGSALVGIAEEMGVVLVRGAYSANVKERRDLSTALFDADGRLVAQAAHIPVHLGAMPDAVAAVTRARPRPGRRVRAQRPVRRRHAPARRHAGLAGRRRRRDARLRRLARAPLGRRRHARRVDPADLDGDPAGGARHPAGAAGAGGELVATCWTSMLANVRTPAHAPWRPAGAAGRGGGRPGAAHGAGGAARRRRRAGGHGGLVGLRRAALAGRGGRAAGRRLPGRGRAGGRRHTRATTSRSASRVAIAGEEMRVDFAGTAPADPRQRQLRDRRHPLGLRVRAARRAAGRHPDQRRPLRAARRCRRPPAASSTRSARPPSSRATRRPRSGSPTPCWRRWRRPSSCPAQGQGTMNNLVLGGEGWTYYETIGGGQGGGPRGPGDSGVHVGMSNALNTPVEALRAGVPLRVRRYELLPGSGGAGRHPRRRRHRAGGRGAGAGRAVAGDRAPPARASRGRGRRGRGARAEPRQRRAGGAKVAVDLAPGDVVTVRTPGGGGWGAP